MTTYISYQIAFDVYYYDSYAVVGYALFENAESEVPFKSGQIQHQGILPYESGQFYKRELPCLLTALDHIQESISLIYVDANVWLDQDQKGLGAYLYESLSQKIPVIGISKSLFNNNTDLIQAVYRPSSAKPLYVSSIGISLDDACAQVKTMHGPYRLPEMIKRADTLCRSNVLPD